jgi:hypothetical protein
MSDITRHSRQEQLEAALAYFQSGLALLDGAGAPAHIGAHVDLAIHELGGILRSRADFHLACADTGRHGLEDVPAS